MKVTKRWAVKNGSAKSQASQAQGFIWSYDFNARINSAKAAIKADEAVSSFIILINIASCLRFFTSITSFPLNSGQKERPMRPRSYESERLA